MNLIVILLYRVRVDAGESWDSIGYGGYDTILAEASGDVKKTVEIEKRAATSTDINDYRIRPEQQANSFANQLVVGSVYK